MKKFSAMCLISIVAIAVMYILELCNNYNFLSYELGMIVGALSVILGLSVRNWRINKLKMKREGDKFKEVLLWKLKSF